MATPTKVSAVAEITNDFKESNAAVLTEYRGLTVAQLKQLRVSLGQETKFSVVKNTLTAIAAKEAGVDAFEGQLSGPTAIAFIKGDAVAAAKSLTDFAKATRRWSSRPASSKARPSTLLRSPPWLPLNPVSCSWPRLPASSRLRWPPLRAPSMPCA